MFGFNNKGRVDWWVDSWVDEYVVVCKWYCFDENKGFFGKFGLGVFKYCFDCDVI